MKLTNDELDAILSKAGLRLAEPYHENQSYVKSKHLLTECLKCGTKAHYTLKYIMEKGGNEPVCRVEYWRRWYESDNGLRGYLTPTPVAPIHRAVSDASRRFDQSTESDARTFAAQHGLDLISLIPGGHAGQELYYVKCQRCGRLSVLRKGDVAWGCSCKIVPPSNTGKQRLVRTPAEGNTPCKSDELCNGLDDHVGNGGDDFDKANERGRNAETQQALPNEKACLRRTSPELTQEWASDLNGDKITPDTVKITSRRNVWWRCLECGHEWQLPVYQRDRSYGQACPKCGKVLNSFAWQYPGIAAEWSTSNPVSPWSIYPGTSLAFVPEWVCRNNPNHVWHAGLAGRVRGSECPECRDYGRSRVAMHHFGEVKKLFDGARCEVPLFNNDFSHNPWTVDILIPTSTDMVVVEYDGAYWHMDKVENDVRKSKDLLDAGYRVLRLREDDLPTLDIGNEGYGELRVRSSAPDPTYTAKLIADWVGTN